MADYFAFRFHEPDDGKRRSLVIFFASRISLDVIARALKQDVTENLVPKNVYIIVLDEGSIRPNECIFDPSFVNEFSSYVGDIQNQLHCLIVNSFGKLSYCDKSEVAENLATSMLHGGMLALFKRHKGLITSTNGYHFIKPSGHHCDKFIRASNLLVSSIDVSFLSISVLPYLRSDLKRIYVDTSSIAFLASIAIRIFKDFDYGAPSIESFESYAVLDQPYDFVEDRSSLLLISATTSGSLANKLLSRTSFSKDQVITLFHINLPKEQLGLFDVSSAIIGGIVSRKAPECDFCTRGTKLIRIAGDQFLPENPKHELLVIRKSDLDKNRQAFFSQFAATGVLGWNSAVSAHEESKEHFFISVGKALSINANPFSEKLKKEIRRVVSRDLAVCIVFEDEGSRALEVKLREYLVEKAGEIKWLTPANLDENEINNAASVMVLAGAITSGRSLLAVSRKLRGIDLSATITYFIGISKLPNQKSYEQLKKDLGQGGHQLVVLSDCYVPRIKEHTKTAWNWEREALQPFGEDDPLGESNQTLPDALRERLQLLTDQSNDPGSLFLPDPDGQPLKLRRNFAFWSDLDISQERLDQSSQADVYWTVQCVLHDLRNASENDGLATTYHTTLISPVNFDRFNDGVIQACLLRAALPIEMDYRVDAVFSRQMTDVILSLIGNWQNAQGEASMEFLMALWTKRLRVNDDHLKEIADLSDENMPEEMKFLMTRLAPIIDDEPT